MGAVLLRGAVIGGELGGDPVDVSVVDGVITNVAPTATSRQDLADPPDVIDLSGCILLPAAVEAHAHLDKAFLAEIIPNPTGDLHGAVGAMGAHRDRTSLDDTIERAERAARLMAANGYRAIRTHVDVTTTGRLMPLEAVCEVRRRLVDVVDIEIVALAGFPVIGPDGAEQRSLLREAMEGGADLVGGCPHLHDDTRAATEVFLELAVDFGAGVDLHTDETLDPHKLGLDDLIAARKAGFPYPVTASHCVSLGMLPLDDQRRIADDVAELGIGIVVNPHTNLFLQGREHRQAMPRGLTAVTTLREAGALVAAGQDNVQDPFNPLGRCDPFEVAALMILAAHTSPGDAYASVSTDAAQVVGRVEPRHHHSYHGRRGRRGHGAEEPDIDPFAPGSPADMIAVRASGIREAIAMAPRGEDRIVIRGGRPLTY